MICILMAISEGSMKQESRPHLLYRQARDLAQSHFRIYCTNLLNRRDLEDLAQQTFRY